MKRFVMGFAMAMCSVLATNIALDMIDGTVDPPRYAVCSVVVASLLMVRFANIVPSGITLTPVRAAVAPFGGQP